MFLFLSFFLFISYAFPLVSSAVSPCVPSATVDSFPTNPGINFQTSKLLGNVSLYSFLSTGGKLTPGCSERSSIFSQSSPYSGPDSTVGSSEIPNLSNWPRLNCPHSQSNLIEFSSEFPSLIQNSNVLIDGGKKILFRSCSLDPAILLNRITVKSGSSLIFDDSPSLLNVREIFVDNGGSLLAGSSSCRLFSSIEIRFHGSLADSSINDSPSGITSKGIISEGLVEFHGKQYFPTWTRLARTIPANSQFISLQDSVNWEVGQQILITPTINFDCPEYYEKKWCSPCESWETCTPIKHQNEVRTIVALKTDLDGSSSILQLDRPVQFSHYGGEEYQAEVALLSRRIIFRGSQSGDQFGGHVKIFGSGEGKFSGIQGENLGQLNILGRYPIHFHILNNATRAKRSYIQDSAIVNSNFRAIVVHGTNDIRISRNVAFNISGMAYYLEVKTKKQQNFLIKIILLFSFIIFLKKFFSFNYNFFVFISNHLI